MIMPTTRVCLGLQDKHRRVGTPGWWGRDRTLMRAPTGRGMWRWLLADRCPVSGGAARGLQDPVDGHLGPTHPKDALNTAKNDPKTRFGNLPLVSLGGPATVSYLRGFAHRATQSPLPSLGRMFELSTPNPTGNTSSLWNGGGRSTGIRVKEMWRAKRGGQEETLPRMVHRSRTAMSREET
jgi:hypothetical protein